MLFTFEKCTHLFSWPIPDIGQHTSVNIGMAGGASERDNFGQTMIYVGGWEKAAVLMQGGWLARRPRAGEGGDHT